MHIAWLHGRTDVAAASGKGSTQIGHSDMVEALCLIHSVATRRGTKLSPIETRGSMLVLLFASGIMTAGCVSLRVSAPFSMLTTRETMLLMKTEFGMEWIIRLPIGPLCSTT